MIVYLTGSIQILFYLLFFFIPLVLFPKTSEIFEFNKIILTYALTALIVSLWLIKIVLQKKVIFRHTTLDIPLLLFLGSQLLSTFISIDTRTSIFGYYSRFNGGLLSLIAYSLLYWAYVSNMNRQKTLKALRFLLYAAVLVSIYGILEHFGIDKDIWVQDVQNRVFSTLGQPNWLAAWVVALTPITWSFALNEQLTIVRQAHHPEQSRGINNLQLAFRNKKFWLWVGLSALFFLTLLYTKSRSGLLGFAAADILFWTTSFFIIHLKHKEFKQTLLKTFVICHLSFVILATVIGTPWTPNLAKLFLHQSLVSNQSPSAGPVLETGGTESGQIRKIVWGGAIDIWYHYPILGSGVETFAFSYYLFRPPEHNLVSEWDYLYNKAHNEYLNFAATSGAAGLVAYLALIIFSLSQISNFQFLISKLKNLKIGNLLGQLEQLEISHLRIALAAGYVSILVTNFFGFSVVPVSIQFFLYPAMAAALERESGRAGEYKSSPKISGLQKLGIIISCSFTLLLFYSISRYWYSDFLYAKGKLENDNGQYASGRQNLALAVKLSPGEALFWDELSQATTGIAVALNEEQNPKADEFANMAISESDQAINLSPANVNLRRTRSSNLIMLSAINPSYLASAKDALEEAVKLAPTDAKLYYNLSLAYLRLGNPQKATETLIKTVEMKPNYEIARYGLALLYIDEGKTLEAKNQLEYILEKINPESVTVKKELDELLR